MMETKRLDNLLVDKNIIGSRKQAKARIMAGEVFVDGKPITKSGKLIPLNADIVVKGKDMPYVSRGGLKLEKAIEIFDLDFKGKIVLDVGASTGGFTDCALQNGATKIYAVDVGYGQLAWNLRQDPRVKVLERTNIRYVEQSILVPPPEIACIDVSFISLRTVVPVVVNLLTNQKELVALVKPQFEVGRDKVGKGGIVRDPSLHKDVLLRIIATVEQYLTCMALGFSPIRGNKGNIEYLIYAKITDSKPCVSVDQVVTDAHLELS